MYGARRTKMAYPEYIGMLRDHGLGSIPGTAAEILDDSVREILSHKKVDVAAWVEIITTAHSLGVPTTSTIMYGHVESPHMWSIISACFAISRKRTHGFTEFVPLRFIHQNTVLFRKGLVAPPPPRGADDFRMYAFSRLFLRGRINNIQTSWVKMGVDVAALTLKAGCNDFSGTLMEESITAQAGGDAGEFVPVDLIERKAAEMGRIAVERILCTESFTESGLPMGRGRLLPSTANITTLAGGVGAAKFLRGLVARIDPRRLSVIVNTGDDEEFYGLHVSPDIDTVTYTLAGMSNPDHRLGLGR